MSGGAGGTSGYPHPTAGLPMQSVCGSAMPSPGAAAQPHREQVSVPRHRFSQRLQKQTALGKGLNPSLC